MENNKKTIDIGAKSGKLLIFGGVYSNFQALQRLKEIANIERVKPENIICTGDIVGYCAQPEECVQEIKQWGIHSIAGNVEIQLREGNEDCGCDFSEGSRCDDFSKQWYPFAQQNLSTESVEWMDTLPEFIRFSYGNRQFLVVHGSMHETSEFIFKSTPWPTKALNFNQGRADIILAGHSGLPFSDKNEDKLWLNAGVIGMPANDGSTHVWYMVIENNDGDVSFQHKSYKYEFERAASLMNEKGLPISYANTLSTGIWDNCEILPQEETANQGKTISS